jgi:hypothetical protein
VLIEDGILVGYMHDRMSARLMGMKAGGNGRRQSYAHMPMPRMTNTAMDNGATPPAEMIEATKRGLYCANFGGGQVDITNGKFVFQCTEAYLIENGKITTPVKGATLIGDGPSALTRVTMIGDDFDFDPGVGVCGKSGQSSFYQNGTAAQGARRRLWSDSRSRRPSSTSSGVSGRTSGVTVTVWPSPSTMRPVWPEARAMTPEVSGRKWLSRLAVTHSRSPSWRTRVNRA